MVEEHVATISLDEAKTFVGDQLLDLSLWHTALQHKNCRGRVRTAGPHEN
jgi:hypothetical protein